MLRRRQVVVPVWCRWTAGPTFGGERAPVAVDDQHRHRRARCQPPQGPRLSQTCPQASVRNDGSQETSTARATEIAKQRARSLAAWQHAGCRTPTRRVARRCRGWSPQWERWTRNERALRSHRRRTGDARKRQLLGRQWPPAQPRAIAGATAVSRPTANRQRARLATGEPC